MLALDRLQEVGRAELERAQRLLRVGRHGRRGRDAGALRLGRERLLVAQAPA